MEKNKLKIRDKVAQKKKHWVRLTRFCNNNCLFCLDKDAQNGEIISFDKITEDLKKGKKEGALKVVLSGGEPTLHPQIAKIIIEAKKLGYQHAQIISNGRMLSAEEFVKELKNAGLDEITLSLHSHKKEQFEEITQVEGSYLQAMRGLINALKYNFVVSVDIVINKINYKTLKDTLKFFIKLGVSEFDLLHLIPFGSAWLNKDKVYYSPIKAKKYLDKAFKLSKNEGLFIWTNRLPAVYLEGYEDLIQHPAKLKDEMKERGRGFRGYFRNDIFLPCFGERCNYCFIAGFCQDLIEFKTKKILEAKNSPLCLNREKNLNRVEKSLRFQQNFNLNRFLDFYIKNRYFVKSLRCKKCPHSNNCNGAWIEDIRQKGFKILRPFKK